MEKFKEKLFGLVVILALGVIFVPMLFNDETQRSASLPRNLPPAPQLKAENNLKKPPVLAQLAKPEERTPEKKKKLDLPADQEVQLAINSAELVPTPSLKPQVKDIGMLEQAKQDSSKSKAPLGRIPTIAASANSQATDQQVLPDQANSLSAQDQAAAKTAEKQRLTAERLAQEKRSAAERLAQEQLLAEQQAQEEKRLAAEQAMQERLLAEQQAQERRIAQQQAQEKRLAAANAARAKLLAEQQAQEERLAEQQAQQKPLAEQQAAVKLAESLAAKEKLISSAHLPRETREKSLPLADTSANSADQEALIVDEETPIAADEEEKIPRSKVKLKSSANNQRNWSVQLGTFSSEQNAKSLAQKLQTAGYEVHTRKIYRNSQDFTVVSITVAGGKSQAAKIKNDLEKRFHLQAILAPND